VKPAEAVAFEDSSTGLRSAAAAGVRTVGVPTLANHALQADWVWPSLAHRDLVAWVKTW
jgi:beta-phosphoglucomutase-like phosphatase (HAD superfamily)